MASWGKIEKLEAVNFADIMSEEYARGLQNEEMKKCDQQIPVKVPEKHDEEDKKLKEFYQIPKEVLMAIQEDESLASAVISDGCDSDTLIAQLLQSQYDHDYNKELKRIEKQRNKNSKVSISFDNFRRDCDMESEEEEYYDDDDYDDPKRDLDRFETNEKIFEGIPKCGFKIDKEGEMITKHDPQICGIRNVRRIMSFPGISTGNGDDFDMKLSNTVFNQLKTYSRKGRKSNKMHDSNENKATSEMGVDARTRLILYKLVNNQILEQLNGIISTGKEAIILHADSCPDYSGDLVLPRECVVKVFRTTLNEFKQRDRYIKDDGRFKERFNKQNKRFVINLWAEKEMFNLKRMKKCGINCPSAILLKKHILVMSFIGTNNKAAPKLKDVLLNVKSLTAVYEEIVDIMHKLYNEAKLVHADFSEYNILWMDEKCWIIDVAQAVEVNHPSALEFLMRDCNNIINFFSGRGVPNLYTKEELFEHITGMPADTYTATMLDRIHAKGASTNIFTDPNQDQDSILYDPFEMAWEKSLQEKREKQLKLEKTKYDLPTTVVDTVDTLQILKIQGPIACDNVSKTCDN